MDLKEDETTVFGCVLVLAYNLRQ